MRAVGDVAIGLSRSRLVAVVVVISLLGAGVGAISGTLGTAGSAFAIGSDAATSSAAELSVVVTDPADVRNRAGDAGAVRGSLGGTLALRTDTDRAEFVVRSRRPDGAWIETNRLTTGAVPAGTVELSSTIGGPGTVFLDAEQSDGFDVDLPGSAVVRRGAVSVTVRLYLDDGTVVTLRDEDAYEFTVDRTAGRVVSFGTGPATADGGEGSVPDDPASGSGSISGGAGRSVAGASGSASDAAGGSESSLGSSSGTPTPIDGGTGDGPAAPTTALFGTGDVLPGSSGVASAEFGSGDAELDTLVLTVGAVTDAENGRTEPERAVDGTPAVGELSEHVDVRIYLLREDGTRRYVGGGDNAFVPLSAVSGASESISVSPDETVSAIVEWRIDRAVGNEIQSDSAALSVHVRFTS